MSETVGVDKDAAKSVGEVVTAGLDVATAVFSILQSVKGITKVLGKHGGRTQGILKKAYIKLGQLTKRASKIDDAFLLSSDPVKGVLLASKLNKLGSKINSLGKEILEQFSESDDFFQDGKSNTTLAHLRQGFSDVYDSPIAISDISPGFRDNFTPKMIDTVQQAVRNNFITSGFLETASSSLIGVGGLGLIRGQLIWYNNSDLDLHLLLPASAGHVYFGNKSVAFNGGNAIAELDHDNLGGVIDAGANQRVENITITGVDIPARNYQFYVHDYSHNGNASTPWDLTLTGDSAQSVQRQSGVFTATDQTSPTYNVNSPGGSF
uniref:Uncharacterized protein n=1 Tax=Candidatus Kentrum sp. LPFa TaxID=2126335 RepID=A0A450X930_9GAMM|nr:MAG: hypothetical protein BECKLPF1236A_GA0070988_100207 [Candidatus Kentron sp. LPFa]VFK25837.1 MAG: hypothetical protein BECKLPF1236C_GA0070990_100268 [Candidatus Kentron sp. LPFa]